MGRLLMWLVGILIAFWLIGFLIRLSFRLIILGTIVFVVLYFLGFVGNRRRR